MRLCAFIIFFFSIHLVPFLGAEPSNCLWGSTSSFWGPNSFIWDPQSFRILKPLSSTTAPSLSLFNLNGNCGAEGPADHVSLLKLFFVSHFLAIGFFPYIGTDFLQDVTLSGFRRLKQVILLFPFLLLPLLLLILSILLFPLLLLLFPLLPLLLLLSPVGIGGDCSE